MKKNLERQRQLRDQKRARLEKLMADVQALEKAVQEEEIDEEVELPQD